MPDGSRRFGGEVEGMHGGVDAGIGFENGDADAELDSVVAEGVG